MSDLNFEPTFECESESKVAVELGIGWAFYLDPIGPMKQRLTVSVVRVFDGRARRGGVREGDLITAINDIAIEDIVSRNKDLFDVLNLFVQKRGVNPLVFSVVREGVEMKIQV